MDTEGLYPLGIEGEALPKWKRDATEFTVSVNYHPTRGIQVFLPKPIAELLGNPKTVTFAVKGKRVEVRATGSP